MIKQGNLWDILQVKLGDSLNTAVVLKTGKRKVLRSHKFGEENIQNAFLSYSLFKEILNT